MKGDTATSTNIFFDAPTYCPCNQLIRRNPSRHLVHPSYSTESDDDVTTPAEANVLSGTDTSHGFRADEVNEAGASTRQAVHVPPPVTPISKSEAGAGIQWPVLLAASELRSPDEMDEYREQLQAKIKELIGRGMKQGTALSYAPHLVRWQVSKTNKLIIFQIDAVHSCNGVTNLIDVCCTISRIVMSPVMVTTPSRQKKLCPFSTLNCLEESRSSSRLKTTAIS